MQDYMRALRDRFDSPPLDDAEMKKEADRLFNALYLELDDSKRITLLNLIDIQSTRRTETAVSSFSSGFKLAWGICNELTQGPPYSFYEEQDAITRQSFFESLENNT